MTPPSEPLAFPPSPSTRGRWLAAFFISAAVSLLVVSPFFWLGNASGHDFQFHAQSWLDAAGQWKEGIFYPRWTEWANHGFGEPRFIFYPPFSWMLGAALSFVVPWNVVPVVFIALVQTFSGMSAFALARRLLPQQAAQQAAIFSAAVYAANPYALVVIYMRSDFAELLAMAFFPLLMLGALQIADLVENRWRTPWMSIAFFAAIFAAVWLSNAPAGVIASYSCTALFAWAALTQRSWRPLARGAAGLALGFGLAGFYLAPAVYEQRWVNIAQVLSAGLLPSENFLYTRTDDPEHTFFNWIASTVAVTLIVLTGAAAIAARRQAQRSESARNGRLWRALLLLAAVAAFLMLRFSFILWKVLPQLRYVQFPWRWMSLLTLPLVVFLGAAVARPRWGWIWPIITFALIGGASFVLVQHGWWDTEDIPVLREAIANGTGFDGTDEYDPADDDHTNIPPKAPEAAVVDTESDSPTPADAQIHVDRWTAEDKELRVRASGPVLLGLRLLNYPAWRVEMNGVRVVPQRGEDFNQMIVSLPAGESRISVRFVRTADQWFGGILSAASLVVALFLLRRPSRP